VPCSILDIMIIMSPLLATGIKASDKI